ncbi:MAG: hypothetical protein JXA94_02665 [Parachlamydiales bacterium]|nr:hypothetical protein [Parachlamydiales bacterium]
MISNIFNHTLQILKNPYQTAKKAIIWSRNHSSIALSAISGLGAIYHYVNRGDFTRVIRYPLATFFYVQAFKDIFNKKTKTALKKFALGFISLSPEIYSFVNIFFQKSQNINTQNPPNFINTAEKTKTANAPNNCLLEYKKKREENLENLLLKDPDFQEKNNSCKKPEVYEEENLSKCQYLAMKRTLANDCLEKMTKNSSFNLSNSDIQSVSTNPYKGLCKVFINLNGYNKIMNSNADLSSVILPTEIFKKMGLDCFLKKNYWAVEFKLFKNKVRSFY